MGIGALRVKSGRCTSEGGAYLPMLTFDHCASAAVYHVLFLIVYIMLYVSYEVVGT